VPRRGSSKGDASEAITVQMGVSAGASAVKLAA
jgi:hypothetical protein